MLLTQVINLDGSTARMASAAAALDAAGIAFVRLPAFDGRGMTDLPLYDRVAALRRFGRELTGGEVGCFLSHLDGARRFLATGARFGLVLEDDLGCGPDAGARLAALLDRVADDRRVGPWQVANLGAPSRHHVTDLGQGLVRAHYFPVTTTAILWTCEGARAFTGAVQRIDMPVDHWLRHWATRNDCGLALTTPLFPAAGLPSEIDRPGKRRSTGRGLIYLLRRQRLIWLSRYRAWRHRRAFAARRR